MLNSTPSLFDSFDINKTTISKTTNMKSSLKFMGAFLLFLTFMLTNTSVYSQNKSRTSPSKSSRHSSQKIVNFGDKNQGIPLCLCLFASGIIFLPCLGPEVSRNVVGVSVYAFCQDPSWRTDFL